MTTRRIWVNVGTFLVLSALLIVWGMSNFLQIGPLRPDVEEVVAEFEESPGLQPGFPVTYLGLQVGRVDRVELVPGRVDVVLHMDPDRDVPRDVTATVRRRSVVGEPYVALDPAVTDDPATAMLVHGDRIPLSATSVLISYEEVFSVVDELLAALPADDLNTIVREVDLGIRDRVETIRSMLADTEDLVASLSADPELLQSITDEVTRITDTVARSSGDLDRGLGDTALLVSALRQDIGALTALLEESPELLSATADLLRTTRPDLECLLESASTIVAGIDPDLADNVERVVARSPDFARVMAAIVHQRVDGPWAGVNVTLDSTPQQERRYPEPLELPDLVAPGTCSNGATGG